MNTETLEPGDLCLPPTKKELIQRGPEYGDPIIIGVDDENSNISHVTEVRDDTIQFFYLGRTLEVPADQLVPTDWGEWVVKDPQTVKTPQQCEWEEFLKKHANWTNRQRINEILKRGKERRVRAKRREKALTTQGAQR